MHQPSHITFVEPVSPNAFPLKGVGAAKRSTLERLIDVIAWMVHLPGRVAEARRNLTLLGQMSDYELSDIGLTRQDLRDASALSLSEPPDALFQRRVTERRMRNRQ